MLEWHAGWCWRCTGWVYFASENWSADCRSWLKYSVIQFVEAWAAASPRPSRTCLLWLILSKTVSFVYIYNIIIYVYIIYIYMYNNKHSDHSVGGTPWALLGQTPSDGYSMVLMGKIGRSNDVLDSQKMVLMVFHTDWLVYWWNFDG